MSGRAEALSFVHDNADDPEFAAHLATREPVTPVPEVMDHLTIYWEAWTDLRNDRFVDPNGWASPIYYVALSQYARDRGMTGPELTRFVTIMRAMDGEYLKWLAEKKPTPETET